jgi:hypothetical protein
MRFPLISLPMIVIGMESDSGSWVSGASGFDPAWLTDVLLVVERLGVDVVDVFGNTELTVLVTFWTNDVTGLVVCVVVDGFGAGAVVGVVVGTGAVVGVVVDGAVAAPTGMKPATDPAANNTPDVTTPAAAKRRFRLIFISLLVWCRWYTHKDPL